jgi:hypothetical protein
MEYEGDITSEKFTAISLQVYPDSYLGVSTGTYTELWRMN